jgi:hypothetical protein
MTKPTHPAGSAERRRSPRVTHRLPLGITDGGEAIHTESVNLSEAGVYCTLDRYLAPMTKLRLDYELPNHGAGKPARITCTGVVVRSEPVITAPDKARFHIAIYFTELSDRDRAAIARFVRHHLSLPFSP